VTRVSNDNRVNNHEVLRSRRGRRVTQERKFKELEAGWGVEGTEGRGGGERGVAGRGHWGRGGILITHLARILSIVS
jgi:hypothetical protein